MRRLFNILPYVYENHLKADYERLEFLGDAVLDLVLADYLYNNAHESEEI